MSIMVYVYGLIGACFLGLGYVLQQDAAARAPLADILSLRLLLDLAKVPRWLGGIGFMVLGQLVSALALTQGDVSRVAPLLATNLLFAMVLLSGGVALFVAAGSPEGSDGGTGPVRRWLVLGSVVAVAFVMVVIARHLRLAEEPPLLAGAAGVLYGLQDALTREAGTRFEDAGLVGLLTSWQPYVIVTSAVIGLVLVQSAFETGQLRQSLPALTAAEPMSAIACGIGFLGDTVRVTPPALAAEVVGLGAAVGGVFLLGRHPAMPSGLPYPEEAGDTEAPLGEGGGRR